MNYTIHRPIGRLAVAVTEGCNIRSRDLGLAGNVGCRVYYDPLRFASEKQKERLVSLDKSAKTIHEIGSTNSKFTTNPVWEKVHESEECLRLKQIVPHDGHFFETEEDAPKHIGCEFPVLQPFRRVDEDNNDDNPHHINAVLDPWKASTAGVVFEIRFRDILNMLPGSDHIFGEVAVPLTTIIQERQTTGWFQVLEIGAKDFVRVEDAGASDGLEIPKIFLKLEWFPPEVSPETDDTLETAREASVVIQEELLRWEITNRDRDKLKQLVVGRSIGAFRTVSGFAGTLQVIQNFLGKVVNTLEALRNLLNFTVSCLTIAVNRKDYVELTSSLPDSRIPTSLPWCWQAPLLHGLYSPYYPRD